LTTENKDFKVKHGLSVTGAGLFGGPVRGADPIHEQDLVTRSYAGEMIAARTLQSITVATTQDIDLGLDTLAGASIDDFTLTAGDRLLVKDQLAESENGVYDINESGPATRAADFNADSQSLQAGDFLYVLFGTVNESTAWAFASQDPQLDVDPLYFNLVGPGRPGEGLITAANNTFEVDTSSLATVTVNPDNPLQRVLDPGIVTSALTEVGILKDLSVDGLATLPGGVNVSENLSVSETQVVINEDLSVAGTAALSGPSVLSGESTISGPLTVSGSSLFSGEANFSAAVTILDPVEQNEPATKNYVDNLVGSDAVEIRTIDDLSNYFNGFESRFLPTYQGYYVELKNPFNLLLTIDGIIQSVGYPDYVWQSVMPRVGFRIDNDGYIAFPEAIPSGSSFDARILVGSDVTQQTKVSPFKAMDIVLGGY
jgi:hypothetical protein